MKVRLLDGHCDTAFELWRKKESLDCNSCHIDLQKASALERYAQVFAFCSYADHPIPWKREELLTLPLRYLRQEVDRNRDRVAFASNAEEIKQLWESGRTAILLSLEGTEIIDCRPERLPSLRENGFVMTTLTWNGDNALAGWHGSDRGLTDLGRTFVRTAQETGIRIDVSHLSETAFWDLCEITCAPILASHSNCRSLWEHTRNLSDDQLRAIAQTGGTVGLNLYPPFLGEHADFETLRRHLEHMLTVCGQTHVALGGDLDGCESLAQGFDSLSGYPAFYRYLQSCGYDEELLDRIFYRNLMAVL